MDCLFCKIIVREIPAEIVYDNSVTLAFLDINPVNPGHVLVVPKEHYPDFISTPAEVLGEITKVAQHVAKAAIQATDSTAFNIGVNNGAAAGQVVGHMHLHVMPRHPEDGHKLWHGTAYADGEMKKIADKIRASLS